MKQSERTLKRLDPVVEGSDQRDRGLSLVEILVSIVLLGTAGVAVVVALGTSIHASAVDKDLATSYEYVQSVSDRIYAANRVPCYQGAATVKATVRYGRKAGTGTAGLDQDCTVTNVQFLGRATVDAPFSWGAFCFKSSDPLNQYYTGPMPSAGARVRHGGRRPRTRVPDSPCAARPRPA